MEKNISSGVIATCLLTAVIIMAGCGKDETAGGAAGAASGAMLGAAVSGRHSKGEGALVGGVIGNYIGRTLGCSSDNKREQSKHKKEVAELKTQNRNLQRQLTKWCGDCNRQVRMKGARSCPDCGGSLIQEKFCERCKTVFTPDSGYRYCPYCSVRAALKGR
ncbi:zinc ribbon domain-containing protein [Candidatus Dependentiae bacterium]|nr:zinc ribbon domain-containing protein [Candidatus Dependentiae bacterium]